MLKKKKWAVEDALTARAAIRAPMAALLDMGGTPRANAAMALVMMTAAGSPLGEPEGRQYAGGISKQLLDAATAGGFTSRTEFVRLIEANEMAPRLEQLAADAVRAIGGAAEFFALLELATTPTDLMGGAQ